MAWDKIFPRCKEACKKELGVGGGKRQKGRYRRSQDKSNTCYNNIKQKGKKE